MSDLRYQSIEQQLIERLPELRPAAEEYWRVEGQPGSDPGPYVFMDGVFQAYVEVLGWLQGQSRRDELLRRAFSVVEDMFGASDEVRDLAAIEVFEGADPGWLKRVRPFVGVSTKTFLERHHPYWSLCSTASDDVVPDIVDLYGVRELIARELGVDLSQGNVVPGRTCRSEQGPA
jgi:hypothetical protein